MLQRVLAMRRATIDASGMLPLWKVTSMWFSNGSIGAADSTNSRRIDGWRCRNSGIHGDNWCCASRSGQLMRSTPVASTASCPNPASASSMASSTRCAAVMKFWPSRVSLSTLDVR